MTKFAEELPEDNLEDWECWDIILDERSEREKFYTATNFRTEVCSVCGFQHKNLQCLNDLT